MVGERTLPGLGLDGFYDLGSGGWKGGMDGNLRVLSAAVQMNVISRVASVPGTPTDGDMHLLTSDQTIALYDAGAWYYLTPQAGWVVYSALDADHFKFNGVAWILLSAFTSLTVTGNITVGGTVDGRDVAADGTKLDLMTVTGVVDIDVMNDRVNALDSAVVIKGGWDASAGSFPGVGVAQTGESWQVTTAGTVDGVDFALNDRIIALVDNASTATFDPNWLKADYSDIVTSVVGQTGIVTIQQIITAMNTEKLDYVPFDVTAAHSVSEGEVAWNVDDGCLDVGMANGVVLQIGQEQHFHVKAGEAITNGDVVYASGAVGASGKIEVTKYIADSSIDELYVMGVATQDIALGAFGYITEFGSVRGIPTNGAAESETWVDGSILYVSSTVAGQLTVIKPVAPNQAIPVAMVVTAHATNGTLFVRPTAGFHIGDLHDVGAVTPADDDVLTWLTNKWVNSPRTVMPSLTVATNVLHVDAVNGRVGLGALAPQEELHIKASIPTIRLDDTDITGYHQFRAANSRFVIEADPNDVDTSSAISFEVDGLEVTRINANGALLHGTITAGSAGVGDIVVNGGIFLGGSAAANELNDYEEGTWTPVLSDGTNSDATYTVQVGSYVKIGNKVHVQGRITTSALGTISGGLSITGLPFVSHTVTNGESTVNFGYAAGLAITAGHALTGYVGSSSSAVSLYLWDGTVGPTPLLDTEFTSDGDIVFSAEYLAA